MAHLMKLQFDTDPVVMRMARKQAGAAVTAVGGTEYEAGRVELAVAEAIANAYEHAYQGGSGPVRVELTYEPGRFAVAVHDEGNRTGAPFQPEFPEPPPDPRVGNGYGLQVIKAVMDEAQLERFEGRGTTLRMGIYLK